MDEMIAELQKRYEVGPGFIRSYLSFFFGKDDYDEGLLDQALHDPARFLWFDFAMSTNLRGSEYRKKLADCIPPGARRYLDVGCAHGGFLVAFSRLGLEVTGLEINPRLVDLARANLADHDIPDCIIQGDILDPRLVESLGTFDVITCNDVIEHVQDAAQAIHNMAGLLNPGGILVIQVPNHNSLRFVFRDGHYNLFGLSLLERNAAVRYHEVMIGKHFGEYDVGEYYDLDDYRQRLEQAGCRPRLLPPLDRRLSRREILYLVRDSLRQYLDFKTSRQSQLPPDLRTLVNRSFRRYLLRFSKDLARLVVQPKSRQRFRETYLMDFWFLLAEK